MHRYRVALRHVLLLVVGLASGVSGAARPGFPRLGALVLLSPSGALCLLFCRPLKQGPQPMMYLLLLGCRRLGELPHEQSGRCDALAGTIEQRVPRLVSLDLPLDVLCS